MRELLKNKLEKIWNEPDFYVGVLSHLKNDEEIKKVIDYVDSKKWKEDWEITLFALNISLDRVNSKE